jgi:DNA primase
MQPKHKIDFRDLKARADFRAVLAHYGLQTVGSGEQTRMRCPFHDDERPSCSVNLAEGVWNCHAGCGAGNVLDLVHRLEAKDGATVTLPMAARTLADICGIDLGDGNGPEPAKEGRRASSGANGTRTSADRPKASPGGPTAAETTTADAGRAEAEPTNKPLGFTLTLDPAHPYLKERQVPPELVRLFGLGGSNKDSMAGRVALPIHNVDGELVAYAGRWVRSSAELPDGEEKYKLPAGFHKGAELYNLHRVKGYRHLVLCEGYFSVIRLHGLKVPATALMGSSISEQQITLLREHCPRLRLITVMLDGDDAGRKAADLVSARLAKHWWVRIATLPDGAQPDTVPEAELLAALGRK